MFLGLGYLLHALFGTQYLRSFSVKKYDASVLNGRASVSRSPSFAFMGSCTRGTGVALFDYAHFTEQIMRASSITVFCVGPKDEKMLQKFYERFDSGNVSFFATWPPQSVLDSAVRARGITHLYILKSGENDGVLASVEHVRNFIHCVFTATQPHGDFYAKISSGVPGVAQIVPHMINFLSQNASDMRATLQIKEHATVFCRYGGLGTFNIEFVHDAVEKISALRSDIYFIFMNTDEFCCDGRDNVKFLPGASDVETRSSFIRTCDAMLHARKDGETFGLAIGEFSVMKRPVITYRGRSHDSTYARNHIEELGKKAILYDNQSSLMSILLTFNRETAMHYVGKGYLRYTPLKVMDVFLHSFLAPEDWELIPDLRTRGGSF